MYRNLLQVLCIVREHKSFVMHLDNQCGTVTYISIIQVDTTKVVYSKSAQISDWLAHCGVDPERLVLGMFASGKGLLVLGLS